MRSHKYRLSRIIWPSSGIRFPIFPPLARSAALYLYLAATKTTTTRRNSRPSAKCGAKSAGRLRKTRISTTYAIAVGSRCRKVAQSPLSHFDCMCISRIVAPPACLPACSSQNVRDFAAAFFVRKRASFFSDSVIAIPEYSFEGRGRLGEEGAGPFLSD